MSRGTENYEQFCKDKLDTLDRYLARRPLFAAERDQAAAGIYCWASEALLGIEGPSERCLAILERAADGAPTYAGVKYMKRRLEEAGAATVTP